MENKNLSKVRLGYFLIILLDCGNNTTFLFCQTKSNMKTCEKIITSDIIATFENRLHQLCHDVCWQAYRSIPALTVPR